MFKASRLLALLLVLAAPVHADGLIDGSDIEGFYAATGTNPGGSGSYKGSVSITRTNETYKVAWHAGST